MAAFFPAIATSYTLWRRLALTFFDNSRKNSLARSDILLSLSSRHVAISLIWPLTLTMSFRIRCVSTIRVFLRTWLEWSRNLRSNTTMWVVTHLPKLMEHYFSTVRLTFCLPDGWSDLSQPSFDSFRLYSILPASSVFLCCVYHTSLK